MPKLRAGVYFDEAKRGALDAYLELAPARRKRLKSFLYGLLESLEPLRPKDVAKFPDGVVQRGEYEWEPGCVVVWLVVLRPKESMPSLTRIKAYRVEVLLILTDV